MIELTDRQAAEYFRRSYVVVDGLWFMKVEEKYGFENALQLDEEVWKVLPKIQARMIMAMKGLNKGFDGLCQAIETRLYLEGFDFQLERTENRLEVEVCRCLWHDTMVKSGRQNLSGIVGDLICRQENSVWASELGNFAFEFGQRICQGDKKCVLKWMLVSY